ncbi:glucose 1-dehydrogenase [Gordonia sp. i37]|uniref:glucose 1-dehydrogenase n=1 Tax=Gordonia sp. i37 TaxID=1961707 RepID=UPI0009AEABDF|nr:glucose 1-dehydrogenase [Gordonia sp. i37]OPX05658.1 3-alpha-hydroxysteroid dehydrogenase [Gordonia sp. i37]
MGQIDDKVAIITGASQGMGEAHARRFVAEGAKVLLVDINDQAGKDIAGQLGSNAYFIQADVTSLSEWTRIADEAARQFGHVNILVNNAGIIGPVSDTVEFSEEAYLHVCAVNQHSQFFGMKTVVPFMQRAGGGSIINVSSVAGLVSIVGAPNIAYVGSKFASRGMTKHAAVSYGKDKIRVNSVHPGYIKTPMMKAATDAEGGGIASMITLGRMAEPEEVTELVLWLASDASSYVTGSEHVIDGGLTAQ